MLYSIEKNCDSDIYSFNGIDLKIKSVENNDSTVKVYIKYNGCNPLISMLFGNFGEEYDLCSICFDVEYEIPKKDNSMYSIVAKDSLNDFIKEIYFFVVENNVAKTLGDKDVCIWDFRSES